MTLSDIQNDTADETSDNDENLLVNASIFEMQINDLQTLIDECIHSVSDVESVEDTIVKNDTDCETSPTEDQVDELDDDLFDPEGQNPLVLSMVGYMVDKEGSMVEM